MVRWRGIVRAIIPALLLFSPIIIALICAIYLYWNGGLTLDSLLAIIILFQTYIIWIQVEVALRQTAIFEIEYEPTFRPKITTNLIGKEFYTTVSLESVGKYPAYNVIVGLVNKTKKEPLKKSSRLSSEVYTLAPNQSIEVLYLPQTEFHEMAIEMNVLYNNVANKMGEIGFFKFSERNEFMLSHAHVNVRQGILLKSIEAFHLAYKVLRFYPREKKKEEKERKGSNRNRVIITATLLVLVGMLLNDFSLHLFELLKIEQSHPFYSFFWSDQMRIRATYTVFWTAYWGLAFILILLLGVLLWKELKRNKPIEK